MDIIKISESAKEKTFSKKIKVYENGKFIEKEFLISSENPCCGTDKLPSFSLSGGLFPFSYSVLTDKSSELFILPGFVDVHVHLREPGFRIKKQLKQVLLLRLQADLLRYAVCQTLTLLPTVLKI